MVPSLRELKSHTGSDRVLPGRTRDPDPSVILLALTGCLPVLDTDWYRTVSPGCSTTLRPTSL
ncbi:hypothetical protein LY76DRAFT_595218 [Colletotrichum caudatum]|nr:hypothetical protein LY76DRAFT_595218 [Colletotrichum caudatum]